VETSCLTSSDTNLAGGKRKRKNHWIPMVQLAALGYRYYTGSSSFHHRTFAQNLSHPSEPSLSHTTFILQTLRGSCFVAKSHLEKQDSRQAANKQIMSQALIRNWLNLGFACLSV